MQSRRRDHAPRLTNEADDLVEVTTFDGRSRGYQLPPAANIDALAK